MYDGHCIEMRYLESVMPAGGRPSFADTIKCQGLAAVDEPLCPAADVDAVFKFPPHYHPQYKEPYSPPHIERGSTIVTTNDAVST